MVAEFLQSIVMRRLRKPAITSVHRRTIAAGLTQFLIWTVAPNERSNYFALKVID